MRGKRRVCAGLPPQRLSGQGRITLLPGPSCARLGPYDDLDVLLFDEPSSLDERPAPGVVRTAEDELQWTADDPGTADAVGTLRPGALAGPLEKWQFGAGDHPVVERRERALADPEDTDSDRRLRAASAACGDRKTDAADEERGTSHVRLLATQTFPFATARSTGLPPTSIVRVTPPCGGIDPRDRAVEPVRDPDRAGAGRKSAAAASHWDPLEHPQRLRVDAQHDILDLARDPDGAVRHRDATWRDREPPDARDSTLRVDPPQPSG